MIDYKTALETTFENLENARKHGNDYLIEKAEIEELLNYLKVMKNFMKNLAQSEHRAIHKLNDIQDICDDALRSEDAEEDMINIHVIEEIEEVLINDMQEDIQEVLDELQLVRPEVLEPRAKRLFDAIMYIADDRDKYMKENQKLKEDINFCLHSIKQEMDMSKDERTRKEMSTCYEILKGDTNDKNT